jgi:hypothetical protein
LQKTFFYLLLIFMLLNTAVLAQDAPFKKQEGLRKKLNNRARIMGYDSGAGAASYSFGAGTSTYFGDLCDEYTCMIFRPSFGIGYSYRWNSRLSFRAEGNYYRLSSKDVWKARNFSFRSSNAELYLGAVYDLLTFHKRLSRRRFLTPYVFGGIGLTYFNPRANYNGIWYSLQPLKTEGVSYSRITPVIPFGIGLRMKLPKGFDLTAEAGFRKSFSDRIDDVSSHKYQPLASFSDPVAAGLSNRSAKGDNYKGYRGNPSKKDGYLIFQIKLSYSPKLKNAGNLPRDRG